MSGRLHITRSITRNNIANLVPPLNFIKPKCQCCYIKTVIKSVCSNKHSVCSTCIMTVLQPSAEPIGSHFSGTCPFTFCGGTLTIDKFRKWISPEFANLLKRRIKIREHNNKKSKMVECFKCDITLYSKFTQKSITCKKCKVKTCTLCNGEWHPGTDCVYASSIVAINAGVTQVVICSHCGNGMEHMRNDGCHHMKCPICKHRTCAVCGISIDSTYCKCPMYCDNTCSCP